MNLKALAPRSSRSRFIPLPLTALQKAQYQQQASSIILSSQHSNLDVFATLAALTTWYRENLPHKEVDTRGNTTSPMLRELLRQRQTAINSENWDALPNLTKLIRRQKRSDKMAAIQYS
eukprot:5037320-Prorocentrum_lima.AAC.1